MIKKSVCDLHFPFLYFMTSLGFLALKMEPKGYSEKSVRITLRCVISNKSADLIYIAAEAWNHATMNAKEFILETDTSWGGGGGEKGSGYSD